jgi:hypothetical protein
MPGGAIHAPFWSPYELYGQIDYMYGWPAWEANNGFTAAQGMLNLVESIMYSVYLWMVYKYGTQEVAKGKVTQKTGWLRSVKVLPGTAGSQAAMLCLAAAIMTLSKTVLYCELLLKLEDVETDG